MTVISRPIDPLPGSRFSTLTDSGGKGELDAPEENPAKNPDRSKWN